MSRKTHGQIYATGLYLSSSSTDFLFFPFYWRRSIYIIACVGLLVYANECVSGLSQHSFLCSAKTGVWQRLSDASGESSHLVSSKFIDLSSRVGNKLCPAYTSLKGIANSLW